MTSLSNQNEAYSKSVIVSLPKDSKYLGIVLPQTKLKDKFLRVFQNPLLEIALNDELTGGDIRVLLAVLSLLDYDNKFYFTISDLSSKMGKKRPNVSKSLSNLVRLNYLKRDTDQFGRRVFFVNPYYVFRTRSSRYKGLVREWDFH